MRMYYLCRKEDVSGTSGTGHIAEVAEFDDGSVVVRWIGSMNMSGVTSTTVFSSLADLRKIHGHEGRTDVELVLDGERVKELEATVETLRGCLRQAAEMLQQNGLSVASGC
jgi:hypothetical protein